MDALLQRVAIGSRIAVIRLRSLGDCVLTTPALALLKAHRPDVRIGAVVEDRFATVFEGNPDVDEILAPRAGDLFRFRPRLAINFHGGTRSVGLMLASAAPLRAGFGHHAHSYLYSEKIPRAQEIFGVERPVHTAEHLASAMFWMGVPRAEIPRAKLFAAGPSPVAGAYAVIHPFASRADKAWPAERFVAVADHLRANAGLESVFVGGPFDDLAPFAQFRTFRDAPLAEVKRLMSAAHLFIGNDSGPAHVAAAFGVPVVVLFGPSDPVTWAPWRTESQVLRSRGSIANISVGEAITAAETLRVKA
jgi:ADP-heptose:LPS heptosyltransferase